MAFTEAVYKDTLTINRIKTLKGAPQVGKEDSIR
jgi:hypothetical protein